MTEQTRVVAHLNDGRLVRGNTQDFFPNRLTFHVLPNDNAPAVEIRCKEMKALFFVKQFAGNPQRRDIQGFITGPAETGQGKKVAVLFKDGELLCGYSLSYMPGRDGFFLFPSDKDSNNLRIYVVTSSTREVKAGPAAEQLAERMLKSREG